MKRTRGLSDKPKETTRRDFLRKTAALAGAAGLSPRLALAEAQGANVKVGFKTEMFWAKCSTAKEAIKEIARAGYEIVEIVAFNPRMDPKELEKSNRPAMLQWVKANGLQVSSICPANLPGTNYKVVNPDPNQRQVGIESIKTCIDMASDFEAPIAIICPGHLVPGVELAQAWDWSVQAYRQCAAMAAERNVTLALHHHFGDIVATVDEMLKIVKDVGMKSFRAMLDPAHMNLKVDKTIAGAVRRLGDRLVHFHLADRREPLDAEPPYKYRVPPGEGALDIEEGMKALREIGYKWNIVIEVFGTHDPCKVAKGCMNHFVRVLRPLLEGKPLETSKKEFTYGVQAYSS